MRDRILHLLANGIKPASVAEMVGCTAAYVSQLLSDPDFREELTTLVTNLPAEEEDKRLDLKYEATEHNILAAINGSLANAKLGELTRALEVVARRQTEVKKIAAFKTAPKTAVQVVNLTLPASFHKLQAPTIEMNTENEVIAIGGNNLAPLASDGVKNLFQKLKERREAQSQLAPAITPDMLGNIERTLNESEIPEDF